MEVTIIDVATLPHSVTKTVTPYSCIFGVRLE